MVLNLNTKKIIYFVVAIITCIVIKIFVLGWAFSDFNNYVKSNVNMISQQYMSIVISEGLCDMTKKFQLKTYNKDSKNYIDLPTSVNRRGGIELSYTFWLKIGENSRNLDDKIIFMRGLNKEYKLKDENVNRLNDIYYTKEDNTTNTDILVKCPLVKFGNITDNKVENLVIQFNTLKNPHNELKLDLNVMKILKSSRNHPRYYLITITFQDDITMDGTERGLLVSVYVNDSMVKTHTIKNDALKVNTGDLHFNPNDSDDETTYVGDLTYHNFALTYKDIYNIFTKGVSNKTCTVNTMSTVQNISSQYESLDLYNQLKQI